MFVSNLETLFAIISVSIIPKNLEKRFGANVEKVLNGSKKNVFQLKLGYVAVIFRAYSGNILL